MEAGFAERAGMVGAPTDADVAKRARTSESTVRRARQDLATAARATVTAINGERAS